MVGGSSGQVSSSGNISGLEGVVGGNHHHMIGDVEGDDFSGDEDEDGMGIVGGHATNLDGLDKD